MQKQKNKALVYFVFIVVFLYTFMWSQANMFLSSLGKPKPPLEIINDPSIQDFFIDKIGISPEKIVISQSSDLFGAMVGIPGRPQLVLSQSLYKNFTKGQLEYVLLHEIGHYKFYQTPIEIVLSLMTILAGIRVIREKPSFYFAIGLGVLCGIAMVQVGRISERQADSFAASKISEPIYMIEATKLFKDYYDQKGLTQNPIVRQLFFRGNPYDNRIKMAEDEIKMRGNQ